MSDEHKLAYLAAVALAGMLLAAKAARSSPPQDPTPPAMDGGVPVSK